jgi:LuxR family maltose regulon positive regulatory protein
MNMPFLMAAALDEALPRGSIHQQVFLKTAKHVTHSNVFFALIYSYFENSDRALKILGLSQRIASIYPMSSPLLATKFYVPPTRSLLVKREHLIEQLNQSIDRRLVLISAPAGFGKTTLLSEWQQQTNLQTSWLSLDRNDNDSMRFWTYVIAALQKVFPNLGASTLALLHSLDKLSFEAFLIPLINEMTELTDEAMLILDDYHVITDRSIHDELAFLIDHLPPQVHVVIASRVDPSLPLARLRVRNQLFELRSTDLSFTQTETVSLLTNITKLPLSKEQAATIQAQTEGWAAGLQLAALSLRHTDNPETFVASLKGTQRHILDYLAEEVLEQQPPHLQTFLLQTSVLDRICGSLAEAVVDETTMNGAETLEQLERRNLFIVPLDPDQTWYRYHHLFQEVLRHFLDRTEPNQIAEYHRRAARWFYQNKLVAEALQHSVIAKDFDWTATLIEQEAQLPNPRIEPPTVLMALEALPSEMVWSRPWLLLADAWALFSSSQFQAAALAVQTIEKLLQQQTSLTNLEKLWGLVTAFKGMQARHQGAIAEATILMEQALQQLPQDDSWLRSMILLNLGVTYFVADNFIAAQKLLPEVSEIGQARGLADPAIAGLYLQAQFLALRGRIDEAIALCQQGLELAQNRGWLATYAGVLVQVALADLLREQNQLEAAAQHLVESLDRGIQNRQPGIMMGYITLARVRQAQGDSQAAQAAIRAAEQCQTWLWATMLSVSACKARLDLAQGNLEGAVRWAETSGLDVEDELRYSFTDQHPCGSELDYLTLARVLIARGRNSFELAMRLLTRLYDFTKAGGRTARMMEVLLLQALVWQARGDRDRALELLQQALNLPRTDDYIRVFVDEGKPMLDLLRAAASKNIHVAFVNRLLDAFGQSKKHSLIEPLSDRELEVLSYLAQGLSDQAIADRLYLSLAAVKWHDRNLYGKLNVNNRTQAVARARELGILK